MVSAEGRVAPDAARYDAINVSDTLPVKNGLCCDRAYTAAMT
jgi:hypothetical protein